jgi:hypothetical protein
MMKFIFKERLCEALDQDKWGGGLFCETSNGKSGPVKDGEYLDPLADITVSKITRLCDVSYLLTACII